MVKIETTRRLKSDAARTVTFWLFAILLATSACASAAETATNTAPSSIRKVVRQYALTSANDFQQRDPRDWRLLASNDNGKSWTVLDRRVNEMFANRHQRRVFTIANTNAYNLYRLQIDNVRDASAYSVQLAELEPLGETLSDVDPVPIFSDSIAAQGDNPPLETVARLFDHQPETKWLDRPANKACASWIQWQYQPPGSAPVTNFAQLASLRTRAAAGYRVRIEAVATDRAVGSNALEFLDNTGALTILGLTELNRYHPGQYVVIEGKSASRGTNAVIAEPRIQLDGRIAESAPVQLLIDQTLSPEDDFQWVEVEGVVQFKGRLDDFNFFELSEGEHSLRVEMPASSAGELPPSGSRVRVSGICRTGFNAEGECRAVLVRASRLKILQLETTDADFSESSAFGKTGEIKTTLTRIEQILRLNRAQLHQQPSVHVRGVITSSLGIYMQDETAGIQIVLAPEIIHEVMRTGEYIELEGKVGTGLTGTPLIYVEKILRSGKGKLPQPQRPSWSQLASGRVDSQWIEMDGTVRATDGAHLLLNCDGRQVTASINTAAAASVKQLVDAAVRVRGVGLAALDDWGRVQGVHLLIPSLEFLEIKQPPPELFSQPVRAIRSIQAFSQSAEFVHQVCIEGVLTLQDDRRLFLQDNTGSVMAILKEDVVLDPKFGASRWAFWRAATNSPLPDELRFQVGDRLQVVGFRDTRGYSPVLTEATVRKIGSGKVNVVQVIPGRLPDWKLDAALVELNTMLLSRVEFGSRIVLELLWEGRTLQAVMPSTGVNLEDIKPGTELRMTGIWQVDTAPYSELGQRVAAVRILPRSPADLVVLSRPPWWTLEHALAVIGGMALVLLAASIWIRQLHRQVEQRSEQLANEIRLREGTERQRALQEERARIAQDLHDDLGAALTQIRFLSAVESRDGTVPEGTRSQLRKVSEKSRYLVASLDEIVWAINPANDYLPKLANYLCHVAEEFFSTTSIRCRLDVDERFPPVTLTSETRHNLYLAFREALNNVAKHSEATEVWLRFKWNDGVLNISIEDNGCGFVEATAKSGEGLINMRRRLDKIGGRYDLASQPGEGTVSRISLPFKLNGGVPENGNGKHR